MHHKQLNLKDVHAGSISIRSSVLAELISLGVRMGEYRIEPILSLAEAETLLQTLQEAITAVRSAGELADSGKGTS